jgi:hypothetical protein
MIIVFRREAVACDLSMMVTAPYRHLSIKHLRI